MQDKTTAKMEAETERNVQAQHSLTMQKNQRANSEFNRQAYNVSVAQANN